MTYRVLSLFSGCGGMDLGLEGGFKFLNRRYTKNKFRVIQAIDNDKRAVAIYNKNFRNHCSELDILDAPNNYFKEHDILIGGFPCQSFSISAQNPKRLGYKDPRGRLFFEMCRILKAKKPRAFIAENVKGIFTANKGEAFNLIINEFKNSGYHIVFKLINSSNYGVPQKRERVFIVGFKYKKDLENFSFPKATTPDDEIKIPLKNALETYNAISENYFFSEKAIKGLKKTKNYKAMNKGRAQDPNKPCNTLTSHLAKVSLNSTDPVLIDRGRYRMFTPREVARIQSFPERFNLSGNRTWDYITLGNAVPPVVMWHIARALDEALS